MIRIIERESGCDEKNWIPIDRGGNSSYIQFQTKRRINGKIKWTPIQIKKDN